MLLFYVFFAVTKVAPAKVTPVEDILAKERSSTGSEAPKS